MRRPRSLFNCYDERQWADAFLEGRLRFQTLVRFREWEEQEVRGDRHEGTSLFAPDAGLQIFNKTDGSAFTMPDHRLTSTASHAEIFVSCLSRSLSPLWDGFKAVGGRREPRNSGLKSTGYEARRTFWARSASRRR